MQSKKHATADAMRLLTVLWQWLIMLPVIYKNRSLRSLEVSSHTCGPRMLCWCGQFYCSHNSSRQNKMEFPCSRLKHQTA
ncbi:hypothetical protein R3I94_003028 [Phoxinus phoxinus]